MVHFFSRVLFVLGFLIGCFVVVIYKNIVRSDIKVIQLKATSKLPFLDSERWNTLKHSRHKNTLLDELRYSNKTFLLLSEQLFNDIPVLCIILVHKKENVKAAKDTWAKGCNKIIYIDLSFDKKSMPIKRNPNTSSWAILCSALKNVPDRYEWVFVVKDNTFVLLENLRYFVSGLDSSELYYLGHTIKFWNTLYNMGQAGYVLSRGTIQLIQDKKHEFCAAGPTYWNREDFYLGFHLAKLNVTVADTRDSRGLSTFHPYSLNQILSPGDTYYKQSIFPTKCCSKHSITFNAIEADKMYTFYYLLYSLQIFYDGHLGNKKPSTPPDEVIWQSFLKERNMSTNISAEQYYDVWVNLIDSPTSFAQRVRRENTDYN